MIDAKAPKSGSYRKTSINVAAKRLASVYILSAHDKLKKIFKNFEKTLDNVVVTC